MCDISQRMKFLPTFFETGPYHDVGMVLYFPRRPKSSSKNLLNFFYFEFEPKFVPLFVLKAPRDYIGDYFFLLFLMRDTKPTSSEDNYLLHFRAFVSSILR